MAGPFITQQNPLTSPRALDSSFPRGHSFPVNHLRRFAKRDFLPEHLRSSLKREPSPHVIFVLIAPPLPEPEALQLLLAPFSPPPTDTDAALPKSPDPSSIHLYSIRVPLLPPLNAQQAEVWTKTLWPVVFNPAAPRGFVAPPPQIINRVLESIRPTTGHYLALAEKVAEEAERSGIGRRVGAVVVDPAIRERIALSGTDNENSWLDAVVAVAGDARYSRCEGGRPSQSELHPGVVPNPATRSYNVDLEGGPELHALMRAADLVASKRRKTVQAHPTDAKALTSLESYFLSHSRPRTQSGDDDSPAPSEELGNTTPETPTQPQFPTSRIRSRDQGGYLCIDLDIYISREPCLCCSMGMLLSRFRSIIFPQKGRLATGGLASEPVVSPIPTGDQGGNVLPGKANEGSPEGQEGGQGARKQYYGLHWRKELNWRSLGFEFVEEGEGSSYAGGQESVPFHA